MLNGNINSVGKIADTSGNKINFDSNTLVIDETNNRVGIGVENPTELLEIRGDSDPTLVIRTASPSAANSADSGKISFRESSDTERINLRYDGANNKFIIDTEDSSNALVINKTDGDVGIGTSSPQYKLNVNGAVGYSITSVTSVSDNLNVSDKSIIKLDTSSNDITINGLNGGRVGQILHLIKSVSSNTVTINHDNSSGEQRVHTPASGGGGSTAYTLSNKEGCTLICISASSDTVGSWRIVDK